MRDLAMMIAALTLAFAAPSIALAAKSPRAMATDSRVKQVAFDPNQVVEIVGTYGYQTMIEFGHDELVKVVSLGDTIAWQTVPFQNRLFLKPVEPDAATNLTVITDKRTYYFKLASARSAAGQTYLVRFLYPGNESGARVSVVQTGSTRAVRASAPRPTTTPDRLAINSHYSAAGNREAIVLERVFDDGRFTYFKFAADADIPAVYTVGADGSESIVSTRREGEFLVVERTARQFTLRHGRAHLCVRNGAYHPNRPPKLAVGKGRKG